MRRPDWMCWIPVAILFMGMSGCTTSRPAVESGSDVGPNEVIVVGRVELSPPLEDADQILDSIGSGRLKNKLFVVTDEKWREKSGPISIGDEYFEATLGEPFYIKSNNKPFYFLKGVIYTEATGSGMDNVELPGGVKVEIHSNDKAVYVGTIRFVRNEYFDITKAQIIDDYDRANAAFKKKFGVKYNLRKALVMPLKFKNNS